MVNISFVSTYLSVLNSLFVIIFTLSASLLNRLFIKSVLRTTHICINNPKKESIWFPILLLICLNVWTFYALYLNSASELSNWYRKRQHSHREIKQNWRERNKRIHLKHNSTHTHKHKHTFIRRKQSSTSFYPFLRDCNVPCCDWLCRQQFFHLNFTAIIIDPMLEVVAQHIVSNVHNHPLKPLPTCCRMQQSTWTYFWPWPSNSIWRDTSPIRILHPGYLHSTILLETRWLKKNFLVITVPPRLGSVLLLSCLQEKLLLYTLFIQICIGLNVHLSMIWFDAKALLLTTFPVFQTQSIKTTVPCACCVYVSKIT